MNLSKKLMVSHIFVAVLVGLIGIAGASISGILIEITLPVVASLAVILLIGFIAAAVLSAFTARKIGTPLLKLSQAADQVASGNLDVVLDQPPNDEIGKLMLSCQRVIDYLQAHADSVNKIAAGEENIEIKAHSNHDALAIGLKNVQGTLKKITAELNNMSSEHNAGDIDVFLPVDEFQGARPRPRATSRSSNSSPASSSRR